MATCNYQSLLNNAACFNCLSPGEQDILELQLLCEILNAGGTGGGGNTSGIQGGQGNYGGGQPTFTPTGTNIGIAIDTSNSREWTYYNGAWH